MKIKEKIKINWEKIRKKVDKDLKKEVKEFLASKIKNGR